MVEKVRYFRRLQRNQRSFIRPDHDGLVPFCTKGSLPSSLISFPRRASFSSNRVSDNGSPDHPSNLVLLWRIFITTSTAISSKVIAAIMTISAGVVGGGGIVWVTIRQAKNHLILAGHVHPVTIPGRCGTIPGSSTEAMLPGNERGIVEHSLSGHARTSRRFAINNSSLSHRLPCVLFSFIGSPFLSYLPALRNMMDRQYHERGSLHPGQCFGPLTFRLVFERAR